MLKLHWFRRSWVYSIYNYSNCTVWKIIQNICRTVQITLAPKRLMLKLATGGALVSAGSITKYNFKQISMNWIHQNNYILKQKPVVRQSHLAAKLQSKQNVLGPRVIRIFSKTLTCSEEFCDNSICTYVKLTYVNCQHILKQKSGY